MGILSMTVTEHVAESIPSHRTKTQKVAEVSQRMGVMPYFAQR